MEHGVKERVFRLLTTVVDFEVRLLDGKGIESFGGD